MLTVSSTFLAVKLPPLMLAARADGALISAADSTMPSSTMAMIWPLLVCVKVRKSSPYSLRMRKLTASPPLGSEPGDCAGKQILVPQGGVRITGEDIVLVFLVAVSFRHLRRFHIAAEDQETRRIAHAQARLDCFAFLASGGELEPQLPLVPFLLFRRIVKVPGQIALAVSRIGETVLPAVIRAELDPAIGDPAELGLEVLAPIRLGWRRRRLVKDGQAFQLIFRLGCIEERLGCRDSAIIIGSVGEDAELQASLLRDQVLAFLHLFLRQRLAARTTWSCSPPLLRPAQFQAAATSGCCCSI